MAIIPLSQSSQNTLSTCNDVITVYFNDIRMSLYVRGVQPIQRMAASSDSQSAVRATNVSSSEADEQLVSQVSSTQANETSQLYQSSVV